MKSQGIVDIKCPVCGRFIGEVRDYGRVICPQCGCEITFKSREERRRQPRPELEVVTAGIDGATS